MEKYGDDIRRIRSFLTEHTEGLSITQISHQLGMNRNTVAKYLDILQIQGMVEGKRVGTSRLYYASSRLPASAILRISSRPVILANHEEAVVDVNREFADFSGFSPAQVLKRPVGTLPLEILEGGPSENIFRSALRGSEQRVKARYFGREKKVDMEVRLVPVVFDDGKKGFSIIFNPDTSNGIRTGIPSMRGIIPPLDDQEEFSLLRLADGTVRAVNPAYSRAAGKSPEDLTGRPFKPLVSPEDELRIRDHLARLTKDNPAGTITYRVVMANGESRWHEWRDRAIFDNSGEKIAYQSFGTDITDLASLRTDLKKTRDTLEETISGRTAELRAVNRQMYAEIARREKIEQELLHTQFAMDNAADMVFWASRNARIQYANKSALATLGYAESELAEEQVGEIFPSFLLGEWDATWDRLKSEGVIKSATSMRCRDGGLVPVEISLRYLEYQGKEFACCFARDVSEVARLANALYHANTKLNLLTSMARHDIQNKITVLLGFLGRTRRKITDPELLRYIEQEEKAARAIRNEILLTRDFKNLGTTPPLWQSIPGAVSAAAGNSRRKSSPVSVDLPDLEVYADEHLQRVFDRLFDFIADRSDGDAGIKVYSTGGEGDLPVVIEGSAPGIPADEKPDLFDPQAGGIDRTGLYVAKEILSLTGASLKEIGTGEDRIRFEIRFPRAACRPRIV